MLSLEPIPHDTASLRSTLASALAPLGVGAAAVQLEGEYPSLAALRLDLTGARFHRDLRPAPGQGTAQPAFFVRDLSVKAAPAYLEVLPFTLSAQGTDATFALQGSSLTLEKCGTGTLDLSFRQAELEAALTTLAREAGEKKGADVKSVKLTLTSEGPGTLQLRVVAEAKAMFMTAKLTITGRVDIQESLEVRISGLSCTGDGMIANLAAGALRPKLAAMEGRTLALRNFVPNLRSVSLGAKDGLQLHADFGG